MRYRYCYKEDGGAEGIRTPDLLIANQPLYQLSYDPIREGQTRIVLAQNGLGCKENRLAETSL